jgi:hypothetical protein
MHILLEALFVGLYSAILFRILLLFIQNKYVLLFSLGFLKHFISYYLNIQTYYCNNGLACNKILDKNETYVATKTYLFGESILEGFWFLFTSLLIFNVIHLLHMFKFIKNEKTIPTLVVFTVGVLTHILVELLNLRAYFCKHNCVVKK